MMAAGITKALVERTTHSKPSEGSRLTEIRELSDGGRFGAGGFYKSVISTVDDGWPSASPAVVDLSFYNDA